MLQDVGSDRRSRREGEVDMQRVDGLVNVLARLMAAERNGVNGELFQDSIDEIEKLQLIVDGAEAASRGDYVVEYGWNSDENKMGYWWGTRGSFCSDRLTWAGTSRLDAWAAIGQKVVDKESPQYRK
jgi:hypothetical protein